jgi:glucose-6-phosphate 1-dehydrogenase
VNHEGTTRRRTAASRRRADAPDTSRPPDHVIVLFGVTGDLARRKLLPGLFHLSAAGLMPRRFRIIGTSTPRSAMTDEQFREYARQAVTDYGRCKPDGDGEAWDTFERRLSYAVEDLSAPGDLVEAIHRAERDVGGSPGLLYHLAVPPSAFSPTITMLGTTGLADRGRLIIEKPFGRDLASAQELDRTIHAVFDETRVFRIDHFLGKESVDNIIALRFANGFLEPLWNREHVSYVQIDVPETLGIEGRGRFYDETGAYRDMIVTHLFHVLGFVAMEPPTGLDAKRLRDENQKVFEALLPIDVRHVVRGQYQGYRDEPGVAPDSGTETMAAVRAEIDNWRWHGVPFLLRSGKMLAESRQTITLGFHRPPLRMFPVRGRDVSAARNNELVIDFADPGSITYHFLVKEPGAAMRLGGATQTFRYEDSFNTEYSLEGYERLYLDAMAGEQTLFTRSDGIERLWEISEPLLKNPPPAEPYSPGSWGPEAPLARLCAPFRWHLPERPASGTTVR